jgi:glycosyltransferase involved in cell wall biosynthesis
VRDISGSRWISTNYLSSPVKGEAKQRLNSVHGIEMERQRIGYVIGQLTYGGAERQLYELVRRLDPREFQGSVYCLSEKTKPFGEMIRNAGTEVRVLRRRCHFDVARMRELASLLRRDRIDIIHSFLFKANGYAWAAARVAGVPHLVTSARNCKEIGFVGDWVNRLAFRASDAIICNGAAVRSFAVRHFKMPIEKSVVIYNGVDLERVSAPQIRPTCAPLDLKPEHKVVITVGRLVAQKDIELFVEGAKILLHYYPQARFVVVGDGPCRLDLMRCAFQSGLDGKISFVGEREDVPELLASADVFWLTSQWEGFPNVVLEAMACGKPVVARDIGSCRELITDGETGFLVPGRDAKQFADYTFGLFTDPAQAKRMGLAGRRLVEEKFSVGRMTEATQSLYRSLLLARRATVGAEILPDAN